MYEIKDFTTEEYDELLWQEVSEVGIGEIEDIYETLVGAAPLGCEVPWVVPPEDLEETRWELYDRTKRLLSRYGLDYDELQAAGELEEIQGAAGEMVLEIAAEMFRHGLWAAKKKLY